MSLDEAHYDIELVDAAELVADAWARAWTIPPQLTVSQWADEHRYIARGAGAEPGKWRTARTPYLREIMDCLSDHSPVREVSFKKSAQIGATEVGINWVGYVIDHAPDSMIVAQPVKDLARSWSTSKFEPATELMDCLAEKIESNNTLEKTYPGGTLWIIWTNSSNQLRSRTARYLFEDELDEYPDDLGGQGSADEQLEARPLSFGDRAKIYRACTPTVAGKSKIDKRYGEGDQREYLVPCPHCGKHQALEIDNLLDDGTFVCRTGCGAAIEEHHKEAMLAERGFGGDAYWHPRNPAADPAHRSYFVWAAYTPPGLGLTWKEIADRRAEAARDPDKQAGFLNLVCGLVFAGERREQVADEVATLAEPGVHLGTVPAGGLILTAGVDCQHDRFEVTVLAHGRGQRARIVDYRVVDGDPSLPTGYEELDALLTSTWANTHGIPMHILSVAIDGGNWTEMVAQYVKRVVGFSGSSRVVQTKRGHHLQRMYLVRGRSEKKSDRAVYRPKKSEVNVREKTVARGVGVWGVGTSVLKHMVHGWISAAIVAKQEAEQRGEPEDIVARMIRFPGGRGEVHDPMKPDPGALPPKYYEGLTCEYFDLALERWIAPKGARNEPLDTLIYAIWASLAPAVKIDTMREPQWAALEAQLEPATDLFSAPKADVPRETKSASAPSRVRAAGIDTKEGWSL